VKETPSDPESASAAEVRETQTPLAAPSYASEHLVYVTE